MAVNPTLAQDTTEGELFPLPQAGETFILKRTGIDFECTLAQGRALWGRGVFFMSTKRIVFVSSAKSCRPDFKSFEIPLASVCEHKFNQPIFGANYLSGQVRPSDTDPASAPLGGIPAPWSLTFNEGGCGTFLGLWYNILAEHAQASEAPGPLAQAAEQGNLNNVAYVDPSDPSVLYLSQPAAAPGTQERTDFELAYEAGELAEVVILEGVGTGKWVKCQILGPGSTPGTWNIHIEQCSEYNNVGGFSDKDVPDIQAEHLRKRGASDERPGSCTVQGCVIT